MRLNPMLAKKALAALSNALYYLAQSIVCTPDDVMEYEAIVKAARAGSQAPQPQRPSQPSQEPKEDLKALREDLKAEERKLAAKEERRKAISDAMAKRQDQPKPAQKATKSESGLPDKPMKQARMEEFLKEWLPRTKSHALKSGGGYVPGMGCAYQGAEHVVKAIYSNGVFLLNRRGTQYHRLVPADQVESLFLKDTGHKGGFSGGQKVLVGFGMKDSDKATSFRPAEVNAVHGQTVQVKYLDTGVIATAKTSHLAPSKE